MKWSSMELEKYKGRKVFITGHTGFKGSWLTTALVNAGAEITGYSLADSNLYELLDMNSRILSVYGDIRNLEQLLQVFHMTQPEIVFHLAAQPLVRESYQNPVTTYETNVMGTVNVLECIRKTKSVKSFLNVTTDKVYRNKEWDWGYRENEELNGFDPYSNSKSCSELVTDSYKKSFLNERYIAVSTARAGNVIGGGDFAKDRIIPDCLRAAEKNQDIILRNPSAVRPFQHVLESVMAYCMIAMKQYEEICFAGNYNVGPNEKDCIETGKLADLFCQSWKRRTGNEIKWQNKSIDGPHESKYLKLDCSKIKNTFGWGPQWSVAEAIDKVVEWVLETQNGMPPEECMKCQIADYLKKGEE